MKTIEDQIKDIKTAHSNAVINKAKAEERKASALAQKENIEKQCEAIGVKPENLAAKKEEVMNEINRNLNLAREALGISNPQDDNDTPF